MQVQALLQGQLVVSVREADGIPVDATGVLAGCIFCHGRHCGIVGLLYFDQSAPSNTLDLLDALEESI